MKKTGMVTNMTSIEYGPSAISTAQVTNSDGSVVNAIVDSFGLRAGTTLAISNLGIESDVSLIKKLSYSDTMTSAYMRKNVILFC